MATIYFLVDLFVFSQRLQESCFATEWIPMIIFSQAASSDLHIHNPCQNRLLSPYLLPILAVA